MYWSYLRLEEVFSVEPSSHGGNKSASSLAIPHTPETTQDVTSALLSSQTHHCFVYPNNYRSRIIIHNRSSASSVYFSISLAISDGTREGILYIPCKHDNHVTYKHRPRRLNPLLIKHSWLQEPLMVMNLLLKVQTGRRESKGDET